MTIPGTDPRKAAFAFPPATSFPDAPSAAGGGGGGRGLPFPFPFPFPFHPGGHFGSVFSLILRHFGLHLSG